MASWQLWATLPTVNWQGLLWPPWVTALPCCILLLFLSFRVGERQDSKLCVKQICRGVSEVSKLPYFSLKSHSSYVNPVSGMESTYTTLSN